MDNINKILVVNLAFIGDVILSTPVIRALKEKYPQSSISMLTIPLTAPIAQLNPYIDKVLYLIQIKKLVHLMMNQDSMHKCQIGQSSSIPIQLAFGILLLKDSICL